MWHTISSNRLCEEAEQRREREVHLQKLSAIKGKIDNKKPKTTSTLKKFVHAKKQRLMEDRKTEIRHENQVLLQKMLNIDARTSEYQQSHTKKKKRVPSSESLNRYTRFKEMEKIAYENQSILRRLQKTQSHYDIRRWNDDSHFRGYLKDQLQSNSGNTQRAKATLTLESTALKPFFNDRPSSSMTNTRSHGSRPASARPGTANRRVKSGIQIKTERARISAPRRRASAHESDRPKSLVPTSTEGKQNHQKTNISQDQEADQTNGGGPKERQPRSTRLTKKKRHSQEEL